MQHLEVSGAVRHTHTHTHTHTYIYIIRGLKVNSVSWAVAVGGKAVGEHPFKQGERNRREIYIRLLYFADSATFVLAESSLVSIHSDTPAKLKLRGQQIF